MIVLGIESSCDDTSIALFDTKKGLISHKRNSQTLIHEKYGGVVPELASRDHIKHIIPLLKNIFEYSKVLYKDIDALAFTMGPGLAGCLLVGASVANSLAMAWNKPVIGIHHLEGHIFSPFISNVHSIKYPFIALIISGGHTQLIHVNNIGIYNIIGRTLDDSAGEAFDKIAKLLNLSYPGGPEISNLAKYGKSGIINFPRPMLKSGNLDFSFSGLKTSVFNYVKNLGINISEQEKANVAYEFINSVTDILLSKSLTAIKKFNVQNLVIAGGVSANEQLRSKFYKATLNYNLNIFYPELSLCTDNGAMIALVGSLRLKLWPEQAIKNYAFTVKPKWDITKIISK